MRRSALAFTSLAVACTLAAGAARADALPAPVRAAIAESVAACKPDEVTLGRGFVSRKDVNGDGVPDYVLDYGAFRCGDSASYFCGSAGCTRQVFASTGGGYVKVLDENVQALAFRRVRGRPAMLLDSHGSACGRTGADPCRATLLWDGTTFRPMK